MTTPAPAVSVIVPVFNGERYLAEAVASIRAQSVSVAEIIIVDDGSTDGTAALAQRLGNIRYFHQVNAGPAAARSLGLSEARGEVLAFLDADDLWPPQRTESLLALLERLPELEIALGRVQLIRDAPDGRSPGRLGEPIAGVHLGSGLFRRSVFERVGTFDAGFRFGEDVDWFLRAAESGAAKQMIDDVTLYYRQHGASLTVDQSSAHRGLLAALRGSLQRRRGVDGNVASLEPLRGIEPDAAVEAEIRCVRQARLERGRDDSD